MAANGEIQMLDPEDIDVKRSIESSNIQLGLLIRYVLSIRYGRLQRANTHSRRGTNKLYNQRVLGLSHQNSLNVRLDIFVLSDDGYLALTMLTSDFWIGNHTIPMGPYGKRKAEPAQVHSAARGGKSCSNPSHE